MLNWIINDFGKMLRPGSDELTRSLGYTAGGPAVENYAIENIGHVGLSVRRGKLHVRCRPALLTERTISALLYWLADRDNSEVVISWLDDVWHLEQSMSRHVAISFLCYLVDKKSPQPAPAQRLLSRESAAVQRRWRRSAPDTMPLLAADSSVENRQRALDASYNSRWTLVELDLQSRQPKSVCLGAGYPPLDPDVARRRDVFNFNERGDPNYRNWIIDNFVEAAITNKPKFEDVDAIVQWPRIGDMRTRYWRFVVPFQNTPNSCSLLSVSGCDSSIDLRPNLIQVNG